MDQYHCTIDGGEGGETDLYATDAADALREAVAWAKAGAWRTYPARFLVRVRGADNPQDTASAFVEIDDDPQHDDVQDDEDTRYFDEP